MAEIIIFGIVNLAVMTLSGISGGGAGLVIAPFLIFLGINPVTAIATSKISGLGVSLGAGSRFHREKLIDYKIQIKFVLIGATGAIIGSLLLVKFSIHEDIIQKLLGYAILVVGLPLLYVKKLGIETKIRSKNVKKTGYAVLFVSTVAASALSGVASIHLIILMAFFGMTALNATIAKRSMQIIAQSISLAVFVFAGFVDYRLGLIALITSLTGGFIGAHIAIKKGNKFIVNLFAAMSIILGLSLIFR